MFGGFITLGLGMSVSIMLWKLIQKEKYLPEDWCKHRKLLIYFMFIIAIPVIIQEKTSGHFDTWHWAIIINYWEAIGFSLGLYYDKFWMNRGWIPQYIVEKPCKDR